MVENAKEAEELDDSVYLGYHPAADWQKEPHESWSIGDNYERIGINLVYRADLDKWFYRNTWDGEDRPMPGGFDEAMGNASIMYTG
jgi:hypothetical protein